MVLKLSATVRSRGVMVGGGLAALLGAWLAPHLSAVPAQAQTGVAPVVRIEGSSTVFPLMEEAAEPPQLDALQTLASALHLWYESHSQRQTATRIATAFRSLTPKT